MKKKMFNKRLVLNKSTVADLEVRQMGAVKGGDTLPFFCIDSELVRCSKGGTCVYNCTTVNPMQICFGTCV